MHRTPTIAARPLATRSKITNRSELLRGIDGRSAEARRYRDLVEGFAADFGDTLPGEREMALVRQAAAMSVQAEALQAVIVRGEAVDLEQLTRLSNVLTRTLKELGIRRRRSQKLSLTDYVAGKHTGAPT